MICQTVYAKLKVTMLDVGQGDAILIQTSTQNVLVDTSDVDEREKLQRELYKLGAYRLDKIILTHPHADHIGNCAWLIKNGVFKVKAIYDNGVISTSKNYLNYVAESEKRNVPRQKLSDGDILELGDGAKFEVIYPPAEMIDALNGLDIRSDSNNEGIVGILTYGNFSMLFTGDAESVVEKDLMSRLNHCNVLKAGHHGSATSSDIDFIKKIKPDYVLISAGQPNIKNGNVYGHPHVQTLMNYIAAGVDKNKIFWTYPNGSITLETDGQNIEVKPTKNISWIDFYLLEKSGTININF